MKPPPSEATTRSTTCEPEVAEACHVATTRDGWELELASARGDVRARHPVLIVPGYAMNSRVLDYQPGRSSLAAALVAAGFEVWSMNLRGTSRSRRTEDPPGQVSLSAYVREDLPAALEVVSSETAADCRAPFCVGISLGGSIVYGHLAGQQHHALAGVVAVGAPLRWETVPPLFRVAFRSRRLARVLPMRGIARVARLVVPPLAHAGLLGAYVNRRRLAESDTQAMAATVEDPSSELNAEIAEWLRVGDLYIGGTNVTRALAAVDLPLLVILANRDGLVPPSAARSVAAVWGGSDVEIVEVGRGADWFGHADLFATSDAPERVFSIVVRWLEEHDCAAR